MIALWFTLTALANPVEAIANLWRAQTEGAVWRSPTHRERAALQDAVDRLVRNAGSCPQHELDEANERLAEHDFRATRISVPGFEGIAVTDGVERRGTGLLVIRCGIAAPLAWQAPHSFYDLKTGGITRQLFIESGARLGFWNTIHRYRSRPDETEDDSVHPADVTREYGSSFHAMTAAAAMADTRLRFVQLHGFAERTGGWDAIVSTGDARRPPDAVAAALAPLGKVGAFGSDTDLLGATSNVQGRALSRFSPPRFLHLEFSPDVRAVLDAQSDSRAIVIRAAGVPL